MEEIISLQKLLQTLKKRIKIIVAVVLVAIITSAIITFFVLTPKYEASTQILVNQSQSNNEEVSSTDLQSSRELVSTYNVIITSPIILEKVIEETNYEGSVGDLESQISVSAEEESQVATVTVENTDPQSAVNLVNTLGQTFEQEIPNIMDVDNVNLLSEADLESSNSPVSPQPTLNLFLALIIGLGIGLGLAFLMEFLDKSLKNEDDIERELNLSILGVIPVMNEKEFKQSENQKKSEINSRSKNRDKERKTS